MLNDGSILSASQASAVHQKLMQLASGGVYKDDGTYSVIDTGRYELVMDLIDARKQCVVAFQWRHQRDELVKAAEQRGFKYGIIDGTTKDKERTRVVQEFQAGLIKVIFAHPQSAGHGLTLTAGNTTIWASPTYNSEHYTQFNARINRAGQQNVTETILICAKDTVDEKVYDRLDHKLTSMQMLLDLLGEKDG
jgi:SNF2 family DNA or RNA helicase